MAEKLVEKLVVWMVWKMVVMLADLLVSWMAGMTAISSVESSVV